MSYYIRLFLVLSSLFFTEVFYSQIFPNFNQYIYNSNVINPAYAGSSERLNITAASRFQWLGIRGAPNTQFLSVHSLLTKKQPIGFGVSIVNDNLGYENSFLINGDLSYTINTSLYNKLSFGVKLGLGSFSLDDDLLIDDRVIGDASLASQGDLSTSWKLNLGFGVFYQTRTFYLGVSTPRIINSIHTNRLNTVEGTPSNAISYFINTGYIYKVRNDLSLKPAVLLRLNDSNPISYDLSMNFLINQRYWLGVLYGSDQSLGIISTIKLDDKFRIGYSYDYSFQNLSINATSSHEIFLKYQLKLRPKCNCPEF